MISFIIPAHNEERLVGATLDAIAAAAEVLGRPHEIIVVDDASTDRTAAIAQERGARVVAVALRHIAAVRNAGARAARGDLFVFVDADTLVNPAVVSRAIAALEAGAVAGGALVHWEGRVPLWSRPVAVLVSGSMLLFKWAAGCFVFCTRAGFEAAGGFNERVYASEEIYFSRAIKRHGRFVVLREPVTTSSRKLRTHSAWDFVRLLGLLALYGMKVARDRRHLDVWYGARRHDDNEERPPDASNIRT